MIPQYPIYIISKGRADTRLTSKALERLRCPYNIVVEPQEYDAYAENIDENKILTLPFSNLGQGSIPARNWVWEHSAARGFERHWILDDNISGFSRFNRNMKLPVATPTIFYIAEHFVDRYTNVPMSGFNYDFFVKRKNIVPPYYFNTRVYSCILLSNKPNDMIMWRGRYNEDTDLSLRFLKRGDCTILFNAFLACKAATMTMKGGNTDELYAAHNSREIMTDSLIEQHPDVVEKTEKFGHVHHQVNYKPFRKNRLVKADSTIYQGVNEFGLVLREYDPDGQMSMF